VNGREGLSVYTLFHGHVVDEGEVVARAKITPFAVPRGLVEGAVGVARSRLAPAGTVLVRGEYWAADGEEVVDADEPIEVTAVEGLRLRVRRARARAAERR